MRFITSLIIFTLAFLTAAQATEITTDPQVFKARRQAVMDAMGRGVAVLYGASGHGNDLGTGQFVQESTFYYLTGISEPGAALILAPGEHPYQEILFLQPRNPEVENWDGRREALSEALNKATGFQSVTRINGLPGRLTSMLQHSKKAVFLGPIVGATSPKPKALSMLQDGISRVPGAGLVNMVELIPEMRRIKDRHEIELVRGAVDITGKGIVAAMKAVKPGLYEFQLQSIVEHEYRMAGAQFLGFPSITAWGPNTTVLHYQRNNRPIENNGLVLLDTGAAWKHYSADITRTFPVNGKFSPRERELYELVLKAADAAIAKVRVGANYHDDVNLTARGVLEEAGYAKYFLHSVGHFMGLDVHDVGDYRKPLKAGVIVTVEPGIYIPEEGIGIRIEDDVLVTKDGPVVLSRHIPRTVEEIEAAMAEGKN